MVNRIEGSVLFLSVFDKDDMSFKIINNRYNEKIIKTLTNIELVEELFLKIKQYETNQILEVIT